MRLARSEDDAFKWRGQLLDLQGEHIEIDGAGYGIGRARLLDILVARATALGVAIRFDHDVASTAALPDADVVVASDGANGINLLEEIFGQQLDRNPLEHLGRADDASLPWLNFRTVTNECWQVAARGVREEVASLETWLWISTEHGTCGSVRPPARWLAPASTVIDY